MKTNFEEFRALFCYFYRSFNENFIRNSEGIQLCSLRVKRNFEGNL